jgi:hypothetical protein
MHEFRDTDSLKNADGSLTEWRTGLSRRLGLYGIITVLFTMALVNYSLRHGRLAIGPTDDDAVYLVDALQRLDILHRSLKQFCLSFVTDPPHSPFSSILAAGSFAILGPHQWAPYAANGLIVLGILLAADYLLMGSAWWTKVAGTLFALSFPFTANCVTEFRPDCAVGVVTGVGLLLLLRTSPFEATNKQALAVGAFAAAALLVKPSFAGFTIIVFGTTWLVSAFLVHEIPRGLASRSWLKALFCYALPSLVLALPYYLLAPKIAQYIINNAFGKYSEVWTLKESQLTALRFYWDSTGGEMMLGRHRYIVFVLGLAALLSEGSRLRCSWRFVLGYFIVLAVAYAIPTIARINNPFIAADADVLILFAGVLLLGRILSENQGFRGRAAGIVAVTVLICAVGFFQWPPAYYNKDDERVETLNRLGEQIYTVIRDYPGSRNARVLFTAPGPVDDMLLRYNALIDGRNFWCPNLHLITDLEAYRAEIDRADFVVASEPGSGAVYESLFGSAVQAPVLEMARANRDLVQTAQLPALNGKFFYIFARRSLTEADGKGLKYLPFDNPWAPLYAR